jgi:hypothetical protein
MPINGPGMKTGLQNGFTAGATTFAAASLSWANAVQTGVTAIVPASTTVAAATTALRTALTAAFNHYTSPYAAPHMETAFAAFAVTLGGGMAGAGFTATPPADEVGFATLFNKTYATHAAAAQAVSDALVTWLKTGTATLSAPPGTVVNWS